MSSETRRRLRLWAPVAGWCALIFALSARSDLGTGPGDNYILPKLGHLLEYGVLWRLAQRAFAGSGRARPGLAAFAFCVLYAGSDEWHQRFVPDRAGRASDVLIDAAGAGLAAFARRRRPY